MRRAANQINTAFEGWEPQGERSLVFEEYLEQYARLQSIILSYQNLMQKEIDAIGKIGTSMLKVEQLYLLICNRISGWYNELAGWSEEYTRLFRFISPDIFCIKKAIMILTEIFTLTSFRKHYRV